MHKTEDSGPKSDRGLASKVGGSLEVKEVELDDEVLSSSNSSEGPSLFSNMSIFESAKEQYKDIISEPLFQCSKVVEIETTPTRSELTADVLNKNIVDSDDISDTSEMDSNLQSIKVLPVNTCKVGLNLSLGFNPVQKRAIYSDSAAAIPRQDLGWNNSPVHFGFARDHRCYPFRLYGTTLVPPWNCVGGLFCPLTFKKMYCGIDFAFLYLRTCLHVDL